MAHEIRFGWALNKTLWAAVFKNDAGTFKVNVTGADDWEVWNDANIATYDISLSEGGGGTGGGIYTGTLSGIAAGVYHIAIYEGDVAATDPTRGHGVVHWDRMALIDTTTLDTSINDDVIGADGDTLEDLSDQLDTVTTTLNTVLNVYDETNG